MKHSTPQPPARRSRLWLLIVALLVIIILPFFLVGENFEAWLNPERAKQWLESLGPYAWAGGIALLVSDLFLPIPGTVLMSAMGLVYGWFWGGVANSAGSVLAGLVAYSLCRMYGRGAARWLAGEAGLQKAETIFHESKSGWLVALSRWMPVLPEAVACLAGLARMPRRLFLVALMAGSIPQGFTFAAFGDSALERPGLALTANVVLPIIFFAITAVLLRRSARPQEQALD